MTILDAIIQGVIQGATEFLPVSSSGHLSISQHIFGIELPGILFDVMLHLGTLIAVVFVYRKLIWRLLKEFGLLIADLFRGRFKWSTMNEDRRLIFMLAIGLLPLFLLFLPIPGTDKGPLRAAGFRQQHFGGGPCPSGYKLNAVSGHMGKPPHGGCQGPRKALGQGGEGRAHPVHCGGRGDYRRDPVSGGGIPRAFAVRVHHVRGAHAGNRPADRP